MFNRPQNFYRRITALLSIAILTFAFAIAGTAFAIGNNMGAGQANPATNPLFNSTGEIQGVQAAAIMANLNGNVITSRTQEFRLFTQNTANTNVQNLSNLTWRMAAADADHITFWAAGAYRNSQFSTANNAASNTYNGRALQSNLLGDFNALTTNWGTNINNIAMQGVSTNGANQNDRMWIPSVTEVNSAAWGGAGAHRNFATNGFSTNAWLRTPTRGFSPFVQGSLEIPGTPGTRAIVVFSSIGLDPPPGDAFAFANNCNSCGDTGGFSLSGNPRAEASLVGTVSVGSRIQIRRMCRTCGIRQSAYWGFENRRIMGTVTSIVTQGSNPTSTIPAVPDTLQVNAMVGTITNAGAVNGGANQGAQVATSHSVRPALRLPRQTIQAAAGNNVTFDVNGGTAVTTPVLVPVNQPATEPSTTRPGYTLQHWENTATNTPWNFATNVTAPLNLRAIWTANTGTVNFSLNGGTGDIPTPLTDRTTNGLWGNMNEAPNTQRVGHLLIGFATAPSDGDMVFNAYGFLVTDPPNIIMPSGGLTLYAQWVPIGAYGGGFGLAELVSEALHRNFQPNNFDTVPEWEAFAVALHRGQWALSYLPNLSPQQVESIATQLRTAMETAR